MTTSPPPPKSVRKRRPKSTTKGWFSSLLARGGGMRPAEGGYETMNEAAARPPLRSKNGVWGAAEGSPQAPRPAQEAGPAPGCKHCGRKGGGEGE